MHRSPWIMRNYFPYPMKPIYYTWIMSMANIGKLRAWHRSRSPPQLLSQRHSLAGCFCIVPISVEKAFFFIILLLHRSRYFFIRYRGSQTVGTKRGEENRRDEWHRHNETTQTQAKCVAKRQQNRSLCCKPLTHVSLLFWPHSVE